MFPEYVARVFFVETVHLGINIGDDGIILLHSQALAGKGGARARDSIIAGQ